MLAMRPARVTELKSAAVVPAQVITRARAADLTAIPVPALSLRPLTEHDREPFIELVRATRPQLDRHCPVQRRNESDGDMFARQLDMTREGDDRASAWRRIAELPDGTIIGAFNMNSIVRGLEFEADANWWVGAPFMNRGLGTAGVRALLRHAFADLPDGLGLQRVHAGIAADNPASLRVATKAGFTREPGIRSYLDIDGEWQVFDAYGASLPTDR